MDELGRSGFIDNDDLEMDDSTMRLLDFKSVRRGMREGDDE
jgi:succinate dehydrogenase flavin-adding protein (antitoxin of CptAB toxin-antitoxin module)